MGSQIDIVSHLRSFAYETVFKKETFKFDGNSDIIAVPQANWMNEKVRESYSEPLVNIELC